MRTVAALFVEQGGPYFELEGVECWDRPDDGQTLLPWGERDGRRYPGAHPVVAHPPCGPWSALRHQYRGDEHNCAPIAVGLVRRWGGVLEHPARSLLWSTLGLPRPGEPADEFGGWSIEVDQCAWGHVARKQTWLYFVGIERAAVVPRTGGTPTHWCSGSRGASSRRGAPVPPGIKVCSAQQRRRTPPAFARWLVELARSAGNRQRTGRTGADANAQSLTFSTDRAEFESATFGSGGRGEHE